MSPAEARVRAALGAGVAPAPADVAAVVAVLDEVRRESADRWQAIGRLAPAAKAQRDRAQDAGRVLAAIRAALESGSLDEVARRDWAQRIGAMLGTHG